MRIVHYRASARRDIDAIANYYGSIDPDVADRILADIEQAVAFLRDYPHLGQPIAGQRLRGKLTRRYRYKVAYRVTRDTVEIVGVFRGQDRSS